METSYIKVSKFNGEDYVDEWLGNVDELSISLLGIQGEEAASYALYHVTVRGAKLELLMLGVKLTTI